MGEPTRQRAMRLALEVYRACEKAEGFQPGANDWSVPLADIVDAWLAAAPQRTEDGPQRIVRDCGCVFVVERSAKDEATWAKRVAVRSCPQGDCVSGWPRIAGAYLIDPEPPESKQP